jgi:hypothetical protein
MESLDLKCAEFGNQIAEGDKVDQPLINAALAVLLEQGVYSLFLFLCSRSTKEEAPASVVRKTLYGLFRPYFKGIPEWEYDKNKQGLLNSIRERFQTRAEDAFFAKDILELALIYARYHLKAKEKKEKGDQKA